jgi:predicted permease
MYNPLPDNWGELILVQGRALPKFEEEAGASWDRVSTGYLQVIGQPVLRGRGFTDADNENSAPVALVNQAFVRRFFPKEDPLEKHFGFDMPEYAGMFRIIGVVRDAKFAGFGLERPARPMLFVPLAQWGHYNDPLMQKLEVRSHFISGIMLVTHAGAGAIEPLVRKALADVDPNLTVTGVRSVEEQIEQSFDQQRSVASLAGLFGVVALILAAVGLYGVTAYSVAQRTGEIGVRMALGANRGSVIQLVLQGAFRRVLFGLLLGIPLAIGAGRLIASELYGVRIWDPLALSVAIASLALCAFIAAIIPAARAASIAPMEALRVE